MSATMRGTTYPSIKAAAHAAGRTERAAHRHLNRFGHLDNLGQPVPWTRPDRCKPIAIGALRFASISEAARALGVSRGTIRNARHRASAREIVLRAAMACAAQEPLL